MNHDVNSVLVTSLYHGGTVSEGDSNNFIVPHIDGESVLTPTHDIHSFGHAEPGSPVSPIPPLLDQVNMTMECVTCICSCYLHK